jgi:hypothetical protein
VAELFVQAEGGLERRLGPRDVVPRDRSGDGIEGGREVLGERVSAAALPGQRVNVTYEADEIEGTGHGGLLGKSAASVLSILCLSGPWDQRDSARRVTA